jgi:hypothetical protein
MIAGAQDGCARNGNSVYGLWSAPAVPENLSFEPAQGGPEYARSGFADNVVAIVTSVGHDDGVGIGRGGGEVKLLGPDGAHYGMDQIYDS